ncbi:MAG: leucine-rich repeat protein [Ruminococcus sp.]
MKKLISITLTIIMVLSAIIIVPTASAKEIRSGDYTYKLLDDGTISIAQYYGRDKNLKLPEKIDGYNVTKISNYAFTKRKALLNKFDSVTVSDTIVTIGRDAFYECTINNFNFGKSVRYISNAPLREATIRYKITVPKENKYFTSKSGVLFTKSMDKIMLYPKYKSGSSYTIPNGVKTTATSAFQENKYLKRIEFSKTLKSIGKWAFSFINNLEKVDFSGRIKTVGEHAFSGCDNLKSIIIPKNVLTIDEFAFAGCCKLNKISIAPNSKLKIKKGAFVNIGVSSLTIPKVMGEAVFANCRKLKNITIPSNVKTITKEEFWNCPKLKTVTIPKTVTKISDKAFGYIDNGYGGSEKIEGFTIKGKTGSTAHKYAKKNGFKFVAI